STPAPCGAQNGSAIGAQRRFSLWRCTDVQETRDVSAAAGRAGRGRRRSRQPRVSLRSGQGFGEQRELALPGALGLLLVVGLRVDRAPAMVGTLVHLDLGGHLRVIEGLAEDVL